MENFPEDIQEEAQIDIRHYLRVIHKRRWVVVAAFVIVVLTVAINDFTQVPMYRADARMIIEKSNPNVISIQEVMNVDTWDPDYKETQYNIIKSRAVARTVIGKLNLAENEEFKFKPRGGFIARVRGSITNTLRSIKSGIVGLMKREEKKPVPGLAFDEEDTRSDSGLVSSFVGRIAVTPVPDSRLVDIGFTAYNPQMAVGIINSLAQAYIDHNLDLRLGAIKDAMAWMNERIEEERVKVEAAERKLQEYREREGIVTEFSGEVETVTAQKLAQLNNQVVAAESARVEAETRYVQAVQMHENPLVLDSIPEVLKNEIIQSIKKTEVDLYKRISEYSKKYGSEHPRMKAAQSELKALQERKSAEVKRIIESLKNEYQVALARESSLIAALEKQKGESLALNKKAIEYGVLKREAEGARELYDLLIRRFKETSVTEDIDTGNIRIIDRAEYAFKTYPNSQRNFKLAIVMGLMLGLGLAFFIEYLDNTIKSPEEVEHYLKVPLMGVVLDHEIKGGRRDSDQNKLEELVTISDPTSAVSESYRGIRTRILFSTTEAPPKSVLVVSAMEGEGKTVSSANLAVIMARTGSRVLLLDCDMRKPRLNTIFGCKRERGVSNLLVGECTIEDAVRRTDVQNLDMIPCGELPPNPSELLGSRAMQELLATLAYDYDRIIIDSPPVTAVTDAVVLSKAVDGVVVVVQAGRTERVIIRRAIEQMQSVNAHVFGVILNRLDASLTKYYHLYSYFYRYYGEDESKQEPPPRSRRRFWQRKERKYTGKDRRFAEGRRLVNRYSDREES
jgi:capsular exopolysaccharide synthesis family protein